MSDHPLYTSAIRKIYDPSMKQMINKEIEAIAKDAFIAGYTSFLWNGTIYTVHLPERGKVIIKRTGLTIEDIQVH